MAAPTSDANTTSIMSVFVVVVHVEETQPTLTSLSSMAIVVVVPGCLFLVPMFTISIFD
jgi:hypothetical protein